jgi:hypothetical protein
VLLEVRPKEWPFLEYAGEPAYHRRVFLQSESTLPSSLAPEPRDGADHPSHRDRDWYRERQNSYRLAESL